MFTVRNYNVISLFAVTTLQLLLVSQISRGAEAHVTSKTGRSTNTAPKLHHFTSPKTRVNLIELYTSEGCSSCPPAEKWFSTLKNDPKLWKSFAPVAFHVDYWDYLGWKDALAKPEFTERQKRYAGLWGNDHIYTPGTVLNGREWTNWRSAGARDLVATSTPGATSATSLPSADKPGTLTATEKTPGRFLVTFTPDSSAPADSSEDRADAPLTTQPRTPRSTPENHAYKAHAALLAQGVNNHVLHGENSGENLLHDFSATETRDIPLKKDGQAFEAILDIPLASANIKAAKWSLVFWITDESESPVQAAGGDL